MRVIELSSSETKAGAVAFAKHITAHIKVFWIGKVLREQ